MSDHPIVRFLTLWRNSLFFRLNVILATVGFCFLLWS